MPPMNALHQQKENNFLFRTKTPAHIASGRNKNTNAAKLKRDKTLHRRKLKNIREKNQTLGI